MIQYANIFGEWKASEFFGIPLVMIQEMMSNNGPRPAVNLSRSRTEFKLSDYNCLCHLSISGLCGSCLFKQYVKEGRIK